MTGRAIVTTRLSRVTMNRPRDVMTNVQRAACRVVLMLFLLPGLPTWVVLDRSITQIRKKERSRRSGDLRQAVLDPGDAGRASADGGPFLGREHAFETGSHRAVDEEPLTDEPDGLVMRML